MQFYRPLQLAGFLLMTHSAFAEDTTIFVSPEGNDNWSGAIAKPVGDDGPLATLEAARDRVRQIRQTGEVSGKVTIKLAPGRFELPQTLLLQPEDSGEPGAELVIEGAGAQQSIISGGRQLSGWVQEGEVWRTTIPAVKDNGWYFRQLFINGRRAQRAKTPNEGFYQVDGPIDGTFDWGQPITEATKSSFRYRDNQITPDMANSGEVEVIALQAWAEFRMQITGMDETSGQVFLSGSCAPSNRENDARYWLENSIEFLDSPGEWYLDRTTGVLTYWPLPGEDMTTAEVIAPAIMHLLHYAGEAALGLTVHDIIIRNVGFAHSDWTLGEYGYTDVQAAFDIPSAVFGYAAERCVLDSCKISQVGIWGFEWSRGSHHNRIENCEITDIGAGGIRIGEGTAFENPTEQTHSNEILNNKVHDIGKVYPAGVGIWIGESYNNHIAWNEVFDTCYSAMSCGWTWGYGKNLARDNIIEYNYMHNISRGWLSDLGAVYTLGVQPGTIIRNNIIHDVESYGYGGWGLYTDEGSSEIVLENNLVYRTKSGGYHHHYGRDNIIRNNIFAFARENQIIRTREEDHLSFTFERNIVYYNSCTAIGSNWNNGKFVMDNNLYWNATGQPVMFHDWTIEQWQAMGHDQNSIFADPLFAAPEKDDFTLSPDSPALKIGFKPFQ